MHAVMHRRRAWVIEYRGRAAWVAVHTLAGETAHIEYPKLRQPLLRSLARPSLVEAVQKAPAVRSRGRQERRAIGLYHRSAPRREVCSPVEAPSKVRSGKKGGNRSDSSGVGNDCCSISGGVLGTDVLCCLCAGRVLLLRLS